ncbi:MAG: 1-acyl-sn-glycerol-3-phosphate acyltransferase [Pseudodesulfovibrio sp.]|uniref:Phospholipid/glycerol acyltransferase n=1 Tax=Pseudodesulfovibrio aespoeensis (strain ATCC 700646 / DSM 10631 / Aspo-2) TaxID=643562 RepID=E6VST6_PSEA9|nr:MULTISPECIES: lysophospholipid acyltransferase family protein [Pseudodesulfovibrio]MBU4192067.1 1-acyl-sn-glycerol-3-phosphate acyltransferase [Pseudomonadota bacterium]ADU63180.1 phospholipid/glycerol acyltransferase [Pseudodesulfovibrio aespoeensis Aspo-2]MBU4243881.1 1-acyl-sn-glycerol-3-phosphate acyltransferase [Pseudomonadota bacterium]MBU4378291.1 1-acyl-sn-glycerol-3-phosphate acyltransferase [Pseudomonadota bacterium]MBU4475977.1 1-acyl-sn-glycerol-3-phosphate acyltransferase [Pseu
MFRRLFFILFLIPVTIYYSIRMLLVDPANCTPEEYDRWGLRWGAAAVWLSGIRIEADMGDIDPKGHYVFIGNHQSNLDIPVLFTLLKGNRIRFVAKKSLFDIPIYGKALAHSGHISIDRDNRRAAMESLNAAVATAQAGISPLVFPEGTRNTQLDDLMDFKIGGMILALKCGLPVVPFVMTGTGKVMPKGAKVIDNRHVVRFKALPVIDPAKYSIKDREAFKDDLRAMMSSAYRELLARDS